MVITCIFCKDTKAQKTSNKKRGITMKEQYPFTLHPLPYPDCSMEPYLSQKTMKVHHDKLLGGYVRTLNGLISKSPEYKDMSLYEIYDQASLKTDKNSTNIRYNAAAIYNHNLFFALLCPTDDGCIRAPQGSLCTAIREKFGSIERFMTQFRDEAMSIKGSGWLFLCKNSRQEPEIIPCPNHSIPNTKEYTPILILDCFEHAYFLDYLNDKKTYYENYFRIINWRLAQMLWNCDIVYK